MEYLVNQDPENGYLVERGAGDEDWQTSLKEMERSEAETCYSGLLGKQATKRIGKLENASFLATVLRHVSPSFQPTANGSGRSKSQGTVSTILRNLITCRAVDTMDSVMEHRHNCIKKKFPTDACFEICKVDKLLSGSARTLDDKREHLTAGSCFDKVSSKRKSTDKGEFPDPIPIPAAYRPASFPTCSLCGKQFKPKNLHSHMKSCRGMKMLTKNAATTSGTREKPSSWRSATPSDSATDQTSLLCH